MTQCWQFGHIQLSPEETKELKDMATIYVQEIVSPFHPKTISLADGRGRHRALQWNHQLKAS